VAQASALDLMVSLGGVDTRAEAARELASYLGVEDVLLFVRDPQLGTLIPAPGLQQTLNGGRTWRAFLKGCSAAARCSGEVELPKGSNRSAHAFVEHGTALVTLGGELRAAELPGVIRLLPLLAAVLAAEQTAVVARSEAAAANEAADRAHALASALEAARAEAAGLNAELGGEHRRKDEFLAMLGHELRNPLAPLVTSLELLRRHTLEPRVLATVLDMMTRQTNQLTRLVDDLLDVSRVSRGRVELRRENLLLSEALGDAVAESRPIVDGRRHVLEIVHPEAPLVVHADRVRLTQVFGNLLNNAAKYTDEGGRLTLSTRREGDDAVVALEDNGIGISADMLPRIFDLFTQAPVSLDRAQGGLGIGLTLVRTLVELHGGRITAESAGTRRGSTFTVRLPLARASVEAAPAKRRPNGAEEKELT
jgi:signal transduction histidine kinase